MSEVDEHGWGIYDCLEAGLDSYGSEKIQELSSAKKDFSEKFVNQLFSKTINLHISASEIGTFIDIRKKILEDDDLRFALEYEIGWHAIGFVKSACERFSQLIPVISQVGPDEKVQKYLVHAAQCYLAGLDLACIFVCRSALEICLKSSLTILGFPEYEEDIDGNYTAGKVIKAAIKEKLITDQTIREMAWAINKAAKKAIHNEHPEDIDDLAFNTLFSLSRVLSHVLSGLDILRQN